MKLKNWLFKQISERHFRKKSRHVEYKNYKDIQTVLVLFESDTLEENKDIDSTIKQLTADGKQVDAVGYTNRKKSLSTKLPNFIILGKNNIDLFDKPQKTFLKKLDKRNYDLLLDLTTYGVLPLLYTTLYTNALLKTGIYKEEYMLYDFAIKNKEENEERLTNRNIFCEQIIFYLKNIETKK